MPLKIIMIAAALLLSGCATVSNETRTPAVLKSGFYAGERYEIRRRLIDGPSGTFEQTSVVYKGQARTCIFDSPNDCEYAAERLIEEYDDMFF